GEFHMKRNRNLKRILGMWVMPTVGLAALATAFLVFFYSPRQRVHSLTCTAGEELATRAKLARVLRESAVGHGIELQLQGTAGSEESLDLVNAGKFDLALVQGGLHVSDRANVRQVATLNIEPLHLLVKKEIFSLVSTNLTALEGKTVN